MFARTIQVLAALLLMLGVAAADAQAQRGGGRFSVEYEGALTGGVTGVRSTFTQAGGALMIELPAVVASYPTVRLTRRAGMPERPGQVAIGADDGFAVEFTHPDLPVAYVAQRGMVRLTQVENGQLVGEFAVVASPAGGNGAPLTLRGRFEASRR